MKVLCVFEIGRGGIALRSLTDLEIISTSCLSGSVRYPVGVDLSGTMNRA